MFTYSETQNLNLQHYNTQVNISMLLNENMHILMPTFINPKTTYVNRMALTLSLSTTLRFFLYK